MKTRRLVASAVLAVAVPFAPLAATVALTGPAYAAVDLSRITLTYGNATAINPVPDPQVGQTLGLAGLPAGNLSISWRTTVGTETLTGAQITVPGEWADAYVQVTITETGVASPSTRTLVTPYRVARAHFAQNGMRPLSELSVTEFRVGVPLQPNLSLVPGNLLDARTTRTYAWFTFDGVTRASIGANSATYTPTAADVGKSIGVEITLSRTGYITVTSDFIGTFERLVQPASTGGDPSAPGTGTPTTPGAGTGTPTTPGAGTTAPAAKVTLKAPAKVKSGKKITLTLKNLAPGTTVTAKGSHAAKKVTKKATSGTVKVSVPGLKLKKSQKSKTVKVKVKAGSFTKTVKVKVVR